MKRSECAEFLRGSLRLQEENGQRRAAKPKTEGRGPELEEKRGLVTVIAFLKGRKWLSRPSREQSKPISDMPAHTDPLLDVANRSDDDDRGRSAASWFSSSLLLHGSLPACCSNVVYSSGTSLTAKTLFSPTSLLTASDHPRSPHPTHCSIRLRRNMCPASPIHFQLYSDLHPRQSTGTPS